MAREEKVPLMFTLAQLSCWSAFYLGKMALESMKVRGRLQENMVADITIFDPNNVAEGSAYDAGKNGLPPKGLPHVIVNGQFVKRDNKATNVMAGQPVRFPVEEKGRFVAASTEQWLNTFSIDTGSLRPDLGKMRNKGSKRKKKSSLEPSPNSSASLPPKRAARWTGNSDWFGDQPSIV